MLQYREKKRLFYFPAYCTVDESCLVVQGKHCENNKSNTKNEYNREQFLKSLGLDHQMGLIRGERLQRHCYRAITNKHVS